MLDTTGTNIQNEEVVTSQQLIDYLEIGTQTTAEIARLQGMIDAAVRLAEDYTGSDIIAKNRQQFFEYFDNREPLHGSPINTITSVTRDGTTLTPDTEYKIIGLQDKKVELTGVTRVTRNLNVTYTTSGFHTDPLIILAIKRLAGNFFVTKTDYSDVTIEQVPLDVQELLNPFVR